MTMIADDERVTLDAIERVLSGASSEDAVRNALHASRDLDNDGRARVSRRIYGVCVLRRALAHQTVNDDAAHLLDVYVRCVEDREPWPHPWPDDARTRISVERSCPPAIVDDLIGSLGIDGADGFLSSSNVPGPRTLRANTLKITRVDLRSLLEKEGIATSLSSTAPHGLDVEGRANLFGSRAWRDGLFEVQDAASQMVASVCDAKAGDVVVDLCAGRGGKTLALAADMRDQGALHVHDVDARALQDMKPRLSRAGVTCVVEGLPDASTADVVLVDAPCSSLGVLRRSPDLRWRFSLEDAAKLPALQLSLIEQGAQLLKPGGRLVYATCTVRKQENDDVVSRVQRLKLLDTRLLLPHVDGTDGFFYAVFAR